MSISFREQKHERFVSQFIIKLKIHFFNSSCKNILDAYHRFLKITYLIL